MVGNRKILIIIFIATFLVTTSSFVIANPYQIFDKTKSIQTNNQLSSINNYNSNISLTIRKPEIGSIYLANKKITSLPISRTVIFGKLTVEIEAYSNNSKIDKVQIYLDDVLKANLTGPYFEWMLDEKIFFKHTLKAVAYDKIGNVATDEIEIRMMCFGRLPKAPTHPEIGVATQNNTDGFNYYNYKDGVGDFVYNQLWYFNFLDDRGTANTSDDIAGVGAYGLANPENLFTGGGVTNSFGMIIREASAGDSFAIFSQEWDPSIPGNFYASETFEPESGPELQNPNGTIEVINPDHYHIAGHVIKDDKEIKWDLHYQRSIGQPWLPWVKWPVPNTLGIIPAWINYHMQMANAVVNGTFYVRDGTDEVNYELINAKGYHDGFYSEFVFSIFEWNWLDFKQDNLSVHLLYPHSPVYSCKDDWETCTPGNLRVVFNDGIEEKEYNFYRNCDWDQSQIFILYGEKAVDPAYPNVEYPTSADITAIDNDGNILELHWSLIRYMIVYFDIPDPFYDTVTFEIIADFTGTFYDAATGKSIPISGPGWADWSGEAFPET